MFAKSESLGNHFSTFQGNNAILVQFILVEFLHIYQLTFQIKKLMQDKIDSVVASESLLPSLTYLMSELVGQAQHKKFPISRWTQGSLTKFKEYCERFSSNSLHQNKHHVHLHMAAHQAWLTAVHNLELIYSSHYNSSTENANIQFSLFPFKRSFNTLQVHFNRVIRHIPKVINSFWNDENVVLCLLRRKTQLSEIYGTDFLNKHFKWPFKIGELLPLLVQRYQDRGFEALVPTIQQIDI